MLFRSLRASADAGSARNDLPRAPCPQDILKVQPPNSLDYRARYDTPADFDGIVDTLDPHCRMTSKGLNVMQNDWTWEEFQETLKVTYSSHRYV